MKLTQAQAELKNELIWDYVDYYAAKRDFAESKKEEDREKMLIFAQKIKELTEKAANLYGAWFPEQCKQRAKGLME
jgi:hypothetical protein